VFSVQQEEKRRSFIRNIDDPNETIIIFKWILLKMLENSLESDDLKKKAMKKSWRG